jgi:hypothetical protein
LRSTDSNAQAEIDERWADIKGNSTELDQEESKWENKVLAIRAEDRRLLQNEFEQRAKEHDDGHRERVKELEDGLSRAKEEIHRMSRPIFFTMSHITYIELKRCVPRW